MSRRVTPKNNQGNRRFFPGYVAHGWFKSKSISVFVSLMLFSSSIAIASTQLPNPKPLILQSSEVIEPLPPSTATPTYYFSPVSSRVTTQHSQVSLGQALLKQIPVAATTPPPTSFLAQAKPQIIREGTQLNLNGRTLNVAWRQWQKGNSVRLGISDAGLQQSLGVELLSTKDATRQPVRWFSSKLILTSQLNAVSRFLDVTDFASAAGWQLQVKDNTLEITSAPARILNIRQGMQDWGSRIVVDLDRPIPWQFSDQRTEGAIALEASIDPSLVAQFNTPPVQTPPVQQRQDAEDAIPIAVAVKSQEAAIRIENTPKQTILRVVAPEGKRLQVYSAPNPNRLIIDVRPDPLVEKEILWAPGIQWRQQYLNLKKAKFPVVWLEIEPTRADISLRPIWSNPNTQVGTAPLLKTAQLWQAAAAINAGFFNRTNQLPLGAIRRDGRWFSGPILNRGAIAWTDSGQFKFGRLTLQENLLTSNGQRLPILFLNSGYVQPGISRYTPEWGQTYTPLSDNEILVLVQNGQVTSQTPGGLAGKSVVMIPKDGYLLTLRKNPPGADLLTTGTPVSIEQGTMPSDFASYPHILGAGPLLVQNQKVVLDAKAEGFSNAFIQQSAIRSCIGTTSKGTLLIAAIHHRVGGKGPTLTETAQLMQLLGAVNALNFDGGSSTGLDLGGQLLDRSSATVARVHNGLGIFRASP
ncbi:MAG: phosphodiester glycosidase family protein [Coleofasciculaceae cyanobacterium]